MQEFVNNNHAAICKCFQGYEILEYLKTKVSAPKTGILVFDSC